MTIHRRDLLKGGAALSALAAFPNLTFAQSLFNPTPGAWRSFQIVTRLEIAKPEGTVQAGSVAVGERNRLVPFRHQRVEDECQSGPGEARPQYGAELLHVEWDATEKAPVVEVTSRITTRDRAVDLAKPGSAPALTEAERKLYLGPTELIPTDGIVKKPPPRLRPRQVRPRKGASDLRMDRREHVPRR